MNSQPPSISESLTKHAGQFNENIGAVRVLATAIIPMADRHDQDAQQNLTSGLEEIFGDHIVKEASLNEDAEESVGEIVIGGPRPPGAKEIKLTPEQHRDLNQKLKAFQESAPRQGAILRRSALTVLTSAIDVLIARLLDAHYSRHPDSLPKEGKAFTLSEVKQFGSLEAFEAQVISSEIDSVLRGSISDQLEDLKKRFGLDVHRIDPIRKQAVEIYQRRNLIVHADGVVNRRYLERVAPELCKQYSAEEGKPLDTSPEYLDEAIDTICLLGILLLQLSWRKWVKRPQRDADTALNAALFECCCKERYSLALRLAELSGSIKIADAFTRRCVLMNHAQCLKRLDRPTEMGHLLEQEDWSDCSLIIRLGLAALRDNLDECVKLYPRAVVAENLPAAALDEWPVFKELRESEEHAKQVRKGVLNAIDR